MKFKTLFYIALIFLGVFGLAVSFIHFYNQLEYLASYDNWAFMGMGYLGISLIYLTLLFWEAE